MKLTTLADILENQYLLKDPAAVFPKQVMLKQGYYLERGSPHDRNVTWFLHRLLDEEPVGIFRMNVGTGQWTFVTMSAPGTYYQASTRFQPPSLDFFKLDKFKDWANEILEHERLT